MSGGSSGHRDLAEVFQLLGSSDLSVLEETVALVKDHMGSLTEPWLLPGLVDFYIQTGNKYARQLLCNVRQQQYKTLLNKIDDHMQKVATRLKSLTLLAHVIRSEPTWIHQILSSRSFQTVIKCLQVDTDLPSVTSALYVVVTLLPKVASKVSSCLNVLCGIYVRLVSWHTIKPAGASETNLLHLHTAVYALFLCLYGMYPCFLIKYLQQNFAVPVQPSGKMLSSTEKEKPIVFENSIVPMLEQVRLHPRLISESTENEMSYEKWRKLECQDIVADICKMTLDVTEHSDCHFSGSGLKVNNEEELSASKIDTVGEKTIQSSIAQESPPLDRTESFWSPSVVIGLSTPPHPSSEVSSPAPSSQQHPGSSKASGQVESTDKSLIDSTRPSSLNMNLTELFIPNRPHQTSSNQSTPLKQLSSLIFPSTSSSGKNETQDETIEMEVKLIKELRNKEEEKDCVEEDFVKKDLQLLTVDSEAEEETENIEMMEMGNKLTSALNLLDLKSESKQYLEKSPNQLLDFHVQLIADSYTKFHDKFPMSSNKDLEWQLFSDNSSSSPEVSCLRSQVLQMHCGMLFERHRRKQHALRARKLLRRVYDTAALEEKNKSLHEEIKLLKSEREGLKLTNKLLGVQLREHETIREDESSNLTKEIGNQKSTIQELDQTIYELKNERDVMKEEFNSLKSKMTKADSRLFAYEQQTKLNMDSRDKLLLCENKLADCERKFFEARETNSILEDQLRWMRGDSAAKIAEAKMLTSAYSRELESLKSSARKNEIELDALGGKFQGQVEELKQKDELIDEQKAYLENVKSMARGQIKAMDSKYSAQKHISQRLEIQVLDLYGRLAAVEGETAVLDKTQLSDGPQSIQNLSTRESLPQHVLSSSPQLSPPIRGGVMADSNVWKQVKTESAKENSDKTDEI